MDRWSFRGFGAFSFFVALVLVAGLSGFLGVAVDAIAAGPLVVDGDFEMGQSSKQLRNKEKPQGWYESRRDGKEGRANLLLSKKKIGGNMTQKAMLKGSSAVNTYVSQRLAQDQKGTFSLQWDIYVKEIQQPVNRSAFQMIGNAFVQGRGANGSGPERFVYLAFENGATPGKINLIALEGGSSPDGAEKKVLARDLNLKTWYTVAVQVDIPGKKYAVTVPGVLDAPVTVNGFSVKGKKPPQVLTHVSFATWNDGPGTFYIDNVK